jgi:hypothetical protein
MDLCIKWIEIVTLINMDGFIRMQKMRLRNIFNRLRRRRALVLKATSVRELHSLHASLLI